MAWLIPIVAFLAPIYLFAFRRHFIARVGLMLLWMVFGATGTWFFLRSQTVRADAATKHIYPLAKHVGLHTIEIPRLSQGSMEGVLRAIDAIPARHVLETFQWSLADNLSVTWFDFQQRDDADPKDTPLFQVAWPVRPGKLNLRYKVEESLISVSNSCSLVVRHDQSALHMLLDHAVPILELYGMGLLLWGGLWFVLQGAAEIHRRWVNLQSHSAQSVTPG